MSCVEGKHVGIKLVEMNGDTQERGQIQMYNLFATRILSKVHTDFDFTESITMH